MPFLNYIRDNIYLITTLIVVGIILVLILISLFKKPEKKKKDVLDDILSLSKEKNAKRFDNHYSLEWVIFKRNLQEYYAYLFNNKEKIICQSEMSASILGIKAIIQKINIAINSSSYLVNEDMNGFFYLIFKSSFNKLLGYTPACSSRADLDKRILELKNTTGIAKVNETVAKDLSMIEYHLDSSLVPKKPNPKNWKVIENYENYHAILNDFAGKFSLLTISYSTKKEAKQSISLYENMIRSGNFVIDVNENYEYMFYLRNDQKEIIFYSLSYPSLKEANDSIENLIKIA